MSSCEQGLRLAARMSAVAPSPMLTLASYASVLKAEGRDILSLATGEPDFDTPAYIQGAAISAMRSGDTHYTPADGTKSLKEAVARKFRRENGLDYKLDEISVGAGAKQVIFNALAATIDPGDEVIVPAPYYPSYLEMTKMHGGVPVVVPTTMEDGFKLRPEALERAISDRTKWFILNSPSNPTGSAYTEAELRALAEVLLRHPHVWVLSDDIYEHLLFADFPFTTIAAVEPRLRPRTLTVNGVSKAFCMTGWRVGYAGGPADLVRAMSTLQSQIIACPPSISQAAAGAALDGSSDVLAEFRAVFRERRDTIAGLLDGISGIRCPIPEGAFYVFPSCAGIIGKSADGKIITNDADFAAYLLDTAGIVVVPGSAFGADNHFRISYAAGTEQLKEACRRISTAVAALT